MFDWLFSIFDKIESRLPGHHHSWVFLGESWPGQTIHVCSECRLCEAQDWTGVFRFSYDQLREANYSRAGMKEKFEAFEAEYGREGTVQTAS